MSPPPSPAARCRHAHSTRHRYVTPRTSLHRCRRERGRPIKARGEGEGEGLGEFKGGSEGASTIYSKKSGADTRIRPSSATLCNNGE
jgi:hypothetical protein